uniref:TRM5/TYW2-like N-terminal domain-containing protein n=1 Tax=Cyanistes caeruleus TaxID=156563 RepID=A0A8C0VU13_CYACU
MLAGPLLPAEPPASPKPAAVLAAGPELWETVASALGARRVARRGRVMPDGMRTPRVTLLLGQHGWVEHLDNGIRWPAEDGGEETLGARLRAEWQRWAEATATRIQGLLAELHGRPWCTSVLHVEPVKSYAPHVHHLVLDLECRPVLPD